MLDKSKSTGAECASPERELTTMGRMKIEGTVEDEREIAQRQHAEEEPQDSGIVIGGNTGDDLGLDDDDGADADAESSEAASEGEPGEAPYRVDRGIPIPDAVTPFTRNFKSPMRRQLESMTRGDSFFVPGAGAKEARNVRSLAASMKISVAQRRVTHKGQEGIRFWHQGKKGVIHDDGLGID